MYCRRPHILRKNEQNFIPERFVFFDTETIPVKRGDEDEQRLVLGTAVYWERHRKQEPMTFYTSSMFWSFVTDHVRRGTALYLIAHNIGFDFRVLDGFGAMKRRGFKLDKIIFNGTSNVWRFVKGSSSVYALDNMNFFSVPLSVLGASIGFPKMEMPKVTERSKLAEYCMNDTNIMVQAWVKLLDFIDDNNLGNFAKTLAGQAFNAFRHRFMNEKIYIHDRQKAIELERESYRGGRTECFRIGTLKGTFTMFDFNSMYPSVMQMLDYPVRLLGEVRTFKAMKKALDGGEGVIASVIVTTTRPVFGIRDSAKKLIFPVGTFQATLTTRELNYALDHDMIDADAPYIEGFRYEMRPIFREYVDFFYRMRQEYIETNNIAFAYICKIFMNSLYGKFGQRNEIYETVGFDSKEADGAFEYWDTDTNQLRKRRVIGGTIQESIGFREGYESFCAIASHVTADARMKLWELFETAGTENVMYCDTDSAVTNEKGTEKLTPLVGKGLGKLSVKGASVHLVLHGNKDYEFGEEVVMKGIKKDAVQIGDGLFEQTQFEGLAGAIRNGRTGRMMTHTMTKQLKRVYDKGVVLKSGRVVPIRLGYQGRLAEGV